MASSSDLFGVHNLPFGIASSPRHANPQCVTRFHDTVIFLAGLAEAGQFDKIHDGLRHVFSQPTLNEFAALSKGIQRQVRRALQDALSTSSAAIPSNCSVSISEVTMHLPVAIGDFTDFSVSKDHNLNAGEAVIGKRMLPPSFTHFPIGYGGRASSITVSGTPIRRPWGQFWDRAANSDPKPVVYAPSREMDYELEMAAIIGTPTKPGERIMAKDADEHIFGVVILNDWSARDIQKLEMMPLGPMNSKNFGTSVSPWVVTLDALEPFGVPSPARDSVAKYLEDPKRGNYSIDVQAEIISGGHSTVTCRSNFRSMWWTFREMLAHQTVGGCFVKTGDIIASGTVSGSGEEEHGCLLESSVGGTRELELQDGSKRTYLLDGDTVRLTAIARKEGVPSIGFGECIGELIAAA